MNNLLSSISIIGLLVMLGVSFYLGGKFQSPEIITETETTTIIDTTLVDSLRSVIEYYEDIPVDEQEPTDIDNGIVINHLIAGTRKITTTHTDSMITATNYLEIDLSGEVVDNKFSYLLKRRLIRDRQTTITKHITRNTTTKTTRTIKEGMYFSVGAISNFDTITPVVAATMRNKTTFLYGYDFYHKNHTVGILIKF